MFMWGWRDKRAVVLLVGRRHTGIEHPVRGKATAHLVEFLAGEFQVSKSAITVVFGVYNVNKQLRITAPKRLPSVIPSP